MFHDFSGILPFFGLKAYTITNWPPVAVDPLTNRELARGAPTQASVQAVIFPVDGFSDQYGAQFATPGIFEAGDMMAFVSGAATEEVHPAIGDDPATQFLLTEGTFAVVREVPYASSGNFRLFQLRKPVNV